MTKLDHERIERLSNFFGGNFHQDWPDEAKDWQGVIALFLEDGWTVTELETLSQDIRAYAQSHDDDAALEKALDHELGCYYMPSADGTAAHDWLEQVAAHLTAVARTA